MYPELLADENIDCRIIQSLRQAGFVVISVREDYRGLHDRKILEIAKEKGLIIITEDKDFGELIYSYKAVNVGVIFLRYHSSVRKAIVTSLLSVIRQHGPALSNKFSVITPKKIRIRDF